MSYMKGMYGSSQSDNEDYDFLNSERDWRVVGNGNRAAQALQGNLATKAQLDTNTVSSMADAIGQREYLRGRAYALAKARSAQKSGSSIGGIASGVLGLGSAISAFTLGGQPVSAALGTLSGLAGRMG